MRPLSSIATSCGYQVITSGITFCEVYSRVVGYLRPVAQWNRGKKEEWKDRAVFSVGNAERKDYQKGAKE